VHVSLTPPTPTEFKRLYDETGWGDRPLETFAAALAGTWITCVARDDDGGILAMARLISDGALHAFVTEMIVVEQARGGGIGAVVLERLVTEARRRGVDDIQLFAASGRAPFYERNGFQRRPTDSPGMDLLTDDAAER
jgi:GNAT superfamily N-acetyltransferase